MAEQGLTYKISADVTDALSKLNKLSKSLEKADDSINNLGKSAREYLNTVSKNAKDLRDAIAGLNLDKSTKEQFDALLKSLDDSLAEAKRKVTRSNNAVVTATKDSVASVSRSFGALKDDLGSLSDKLKDESKEAAEEIKSDAQGTASVIIDVLGNVKSAIATLGITKLTKDILNAASEAERALFALNKIYKSNADEAQALAESLSDMYAVSEASAARQLADASKILDIYNLSDDVLLDMSSNMVVLAQDLSAFTGGAVDATRAMSAVESALNSDYRALKKTFGIFINDDTIKNLAKRWGLEADNLNATQKVLLRYQAVMEATTNVAGSFVESQDSLYVAEQQLQAAWQDLQVTLGERVLPLITTLTKAATYLVTFLSDTGIGALLTVVSVTAAVVSIVNKLVLALNSLKAALLSVSASLGPLGVVFALLGVIVPIILSLVSASKELKNEEEDQVTTTNALVQSIDAYAESERKRKKAIDDVTSALLQQHMVENRKEVETGVSHLIYQLDVRTRGLSEAKSARDYAKDSASDAYDTFSKAIKRYGATSSQATSAGKNYEAELETVAIREEEVDKASSELNKTLASLAETYYALTNSNIGGVWDEQIALIESMLEPDQLPLFNSLLETVAKNGGKAATSIEELAKAFGFNEQDWDKMLETSSAKLLSSQQALEKSSDEYRKIRNDSLKALKDEYKGYVKDIDDQIKALNKQKDSSPNKEAIEQEIERLENSKKLAWQWYSDMYNYYDNVYLKNIQTAAEQLEGKLSALVYKREQTIKEQEDTTIKELETKWKEYAKVFNASIGGGTEIGSVVDNETFDAYIKSIEKLPDVTEEMITNLTIAWETYQKSLLDAEEYYARQRENKLRELEDSLLSTRMASSRISLVEKQELELEQLDNQYAKEQEMLEREYGDSEEYEEMKTILRNKHLQERMNMEDSHADALHSLLVAQETRMRQAELASTTTTLEQKYALEKKARDLQRSEEIRTANQTGKSVKDINAYYDKLDENAEAEHQQKLADIAREQSKAIATAERALLYDKQEIYESEKAMLEEELDYELKQADKTGKDKVQIQRLYTLKIEKIALEHYNRLAQITRNYNKSLVDAQVANNQPRGGYFDLIANAMSRRDLSRKQTATNIVDYIGGVEGIDPNKYASYAKGYVQDLQNAMAEGLSEEELKAKVQSMLSTLGYAGEDMELIWGNIWEQMKANTQSELDQLAEIVNNSLDALTDVFGKLDTLFTMSESNRMQNLQNMLTDLQNQRDKLEKEASDSGRKLTKKEKDELERRQDLYEEQIERQEELIKQQKERQFEREKEFAIAEATIQGVQAAVQSFNKNGGWPLGLVAATMSAAFTAAQIAMIKAQPMPSYAQGAYELPQDQTAQVHKGEMIIPKPFAEELRDKGGIGGEITVNVYGAGEEASVETSSDANGVQQLDIYVSNKVKGMVMRGELDTVLQARYTLSRNGRRG